MDHIEILTDRVVEIIKSRLPDDKYRREAIRRYQEAALWTVTILNVPE